VKGFNIVTWNVFPCLDSWLALAVDLIAFAGTAVTSCCRDSDSSKAATAAAAAATLFYKIKKNSFVSLSSTAGG